MLYCYAGSGEKKSPGKQEIRLNLFTSDEEEAQASIAKPNVQEEGSQVINIDASQKQQNRELARIMGELTVDSSGGGDDDLLDLMDSASK